ncbi:hypothetical protein [Stenotrophomonas sp. SY1]|uniref:hypothetical protein n=1 Tax=Stenotrophomonas sp. SY1 TaxID=477235 RepID=UPI001E533551|nr:hypothetical protein [Stenotrophomonas sp. SY1]MCD9086124.1 hypothetical protein [Stenotrophomonas sp. SY1]
MSANHAAYHFSITCRTGDVTVLHCLRAIAQCVEQAPFPQIGWGGSTHASWKRSGGEFTIRFTDAAYRSNFVSESNRLLAGHWSIVTTHDDDPASPQR